MITAMIFDLDGTLVQSEKLKAQSYAIAVQRMRVLPEPENRAIEAYRDIVGASRQVASRHVHGQPKLGIRVAAVGGGVRSDRSLGGAFFHA